MDDLAGLNWSGKQSSTGNTVGGGGSSGSRAGSMTPNYSPNVNSGVKNASIRSSSPMGKTSAVQKDDPFGELVSFTSSSAARTSSAKMTLRERQQMLDGQSRSRSLTPVAASNGNIKPFADTWNFDVMEQADLSRSATRTPVPQQPPARLAAVDALDFDPLGGFKAATPAAANTDRIPKGDFGRPLGVEDSSSSDDDPFPIDVVSPVSVRREPTANRDFDIAQIAECGFSADQAATALEIAGNSRAAIQLLREQQATVREISGQQSWLRQAAPAPRQQQARTNNQRAYHDGSAGNGDKDPPDDDDDDDDDGGGGGGFYYDDPRRRSAFSGRGRSAAGQPSTSLSFAAAKVPSADKLLATANELGTNVWKQANSWFAMGKKKVMELQETVMDQRKPSTHDFGGTWQSRTLESEYLPSAQRYRDYGSSSSDDEHDAYVSANRRGRQDAKQPGTRSTADIGINAKSDATPASHSQSYLHPSRSLATQPNTPAHRPPVTSTLSAKPSPASIPPVPGHALQESNAAKVGANEQFKLGQFGDAIMGYTQAIASVSQHSSLHPVLIVLYNNRALAYARNGEAKSASADCSLALDLCGKYQANGVIELAGAAGRVDVGEQRAKSLQRRAEAYEASECYREGLVDWRSLREVARDSGQRQQSTRGIQRCEKVLGIGQPASSKSATPKPAVESKPEDLASVFASISLSAVKSGASNILTMQTENSAAVAELRKKDQAKRDEDDQRLVLVDQVDAELKRWRDGKQQNIRALLSSLHTLLPEFTPIGMHDILEPSKVKRAYMRAIAKLHPDKLSQGIDLRTKMISSSVFSSLNEAWDAFKAQESIS
ncbi:auxilin-like clathrin-binding protein required for normal clathrin function [Coemansia sp. BCRC 34301]|nr:auxilin-like clathrin-binding protein required for normal clathrin function [Coemansia sp. BCRC 34301]